MRARTRPQCSQTITLHDRQGLHARPAALFVQMAGRFASDVILRKGRKRVNAKSIMGVLTLAAGAGSRITIETTGPDAPEALRTLAQLVENNFSMETEG